MTTQHADNVPAVRRLGRSPLSVYVTAAMEEMAHRNEYGHTGFSLGITPAVDEHLKTSIQPGELILIPAATGTGKTTLTNQMILMCAAQGIPVLGSILEDRPEDSVLRMFANYLTMNVGTLRRGFVGPNGESLPIPESVQTAADVLSELDVEISDNQGTVEELAYEAQAWALSKRAEGKPFGVWFIDQLPNIYPSEPKGWRQRFGAGSPVPPNPDNESARMGWQAQMLKAVAKKLGIVIVLFTQTNYERDEDGFPYEKSVFGSARVGHWASAILFPHRPKKIKAENPGPGQPLWVDNTGDRMWIVVAKSRLGTRLLQEVTWDGAHQRVTDLVRPLGSAFVAPTAMDARATEAITKLNALRAQQERRKSVSALVAGGMARDEAEAAVPEPGTEPMSLVITPTAALPVPPRKGDGSDSLTMLDGFSHRPAPAGTVVEPAQGPLFATGTVIEAEVPETPATPAQRAAGGFGGGAAAIDLSKLPVADWEDDVPFSDEPPADDVPPF